MASFLFAHWEGGGNTPPLLSVMRRLVARGHTVRLIGEPCNRQEVEATGASLVSYTRAPHRADKSAQSDPLRDWEVKSPLALMARARDVLFFGPAFALAQDVMEALKVVPADTVVTGEALFGVM